MAGAATKLPVRQGIDVDRIEASFVKGVPTVNLLKSAEAKKAGKKIAIKAA